MGATTTSPILADDARRQLVTAAASLRRVETGAGELTILLHDLARAIEILAHPRGDEPWRDMRVVFPGTAGDRRAVRARAAASG